MRGKRQAGIFENWFKTFTVTVFTQSFHAIFLVFILNMLSEVAGKQSEDIANVMTHQPGMLAIIAIAGAMALIKLEKFIRQIFGIAESPVLGGIGSNFAKGAAAIVSTQALAKRTMEPFKEQQKASRARMDKLGEFKKAGQNIGFGDQDFTRLSGLKSPEEKNAYIKQRQAEFLAQNSGISEPSTTTTTTSSNYNNDSSIRDHILDTNNPNAMPGGGNRTAGGGIYTGSRGVAGGASNGGVSGDMNELARQISKLNSKMETITATVTTGGSGSSDAKKAATEKVEAFNKARSEYNKSIADDDFNKMKMVTRAGTTGAAALIGLGATDNIGDMMTVTNLVDAPMDMVTDRGAKSAAYSNAYQKTGDEKLLADIPKSISELASEMKNYAKKAESPARTSVNATFHVTSKNIKDARKKIKNDVDYL